MLYAFENPFEEPEQPEITEVDVKEADAAIYVISRNSGEGKDRRAEKGDYYLSDRELQNIRFMTEHYKNCIVLLNVGGVIDLTSLKAIEGVQAIMLVGQTGNMGGYAVADVLTAKTIPSGKLTDVMVSFGHIRTKNAKDWKEKLGGTDEMVNQTGIIGVTEPIYNDMIAYSKNSELMQEDRKSVV